MMLAAPEFVVAEFVELLDQIEIAAELQHRVFANGMVRGEESAETKARHGAWLLSLDTIDSAFPSATELVGCANTFGKETSDGTLRNAHLHAACGQDGALGTASLTEAWACILSMHRSICGAPGCRATSRTGRSRISRRRKPSH